MREFLFHPAVSQLANLLILAGLALVLFAVFSREGGELEPNPRLRMLSLAVGVALLVMVYGIRGQIQGNHIGWKPPVLPALAQQQPPARTPPPQPSETEDEDEAAPARRAPAPPYPTKASDSSPHPLLVKAPVKAEVAPPAQDLFSGNWRSTDPNARDVLLLKMQRQGGELVARAWGSCGGQLCDWGSQQATVSGGEIASVTWENGAVRRHITVRLDGERLQLVLDSAFRDRRPPRHCEEELERRP